MAIIVRIDIAPLRHFIAVGGISVAFLIIALIIGGSGPRTLKSQIYYAYGCPNNSHDWNPAICIGQQLSDNAAVWMTFFPTMGLMNRFFTFDIAPYNLNATEFPMKLDVHVSLYGTNQNNTNTLLTIAQDVGVENIYCPKDQFNVPCSENLLVYEDRIQFSYYQIVINIPNGNQSQWVGDIRFTLYYGNKAFSQLEIALRFLFMIAQIAVLVVFVLKTKNMKFAKWQWEQKSLLILIFATILYNNPFYGFKYVVSGWFLPLLNEFFVTIFHCTILLFWLIASERTRMTELHLKFWNYHIPKLIAVCIFGVLEIILFAWINVVDEADPVFSTAVSGIQVMYFIVTSVWTLLVLWILIITFLTVPIILKKRYLVPHFAFYGVTSLIVVICQLGGILAGVFGPLGKTAMSFSFYLFIYNLYIFVLAWGYWPVEFRYDSSNGVEVSADENSRLVFGQ